MTTRGAILIEASSIPGQTDLPGARADVDNYKRWLMSPPGGAWRNDEIAVLSHPRKGVLEGYLTLLATKDYGFVAFSGHGHHIRGTMTEDTMVQLNKDEEFAARKLSPGCKRCTVIADSCRHVTIHLSLNEQFRFAKAAKFSDDFENLRRHRKFFDDYLMLAEEGSVFLYSCALNQGAGDFKNGGAFSFSLIDLARKWADDASAGTVLNTYDAFSQAKRLLESTPGSGQSPQMDGSMRRRIHFPFGVVS